MKEEKIRQEISKLLLQFIKLREKQKQFVSGKTKVQYSGIVYDEKELNAIVECLLDGWFGVSKNAMLFEKRFAALLAVKGAVLCNSGSSANLLAVSALKSDLLQNKLHLGDEVITVATTFPTTLNPIIQNSLVPVFVDIRLGSYNLDESKLQGALSEKTRAVMLPHTLGNPAEMDAIMEFAEKNSLFVIEDTADALGSKYDGKMLGSFGAMSTFSFYVAHHITMGEGGAVAFNDEQFEPIVRSLRDWGRACACKVCSISMQPDSRCPFRFKKEWRGLPADYDSKYVYTNIGYNLKPLELQAAMGLQQLHKLPYFIKARKKNFSKLFNALSEYNGKFILPESSEKADPCWFAFPLTIKDNAGFKRKEILEWLDKNNIENRLLFGGNILRHPAYRNINCRIAGSLQNSDKAMRDTFFIGVWPGLSSEMTDFVIECFDSFMRKPC